MNNPCPVCGSKQPADQPWTTTCPRCLHNLTAKRPARELSVRYVGAERWKTPEAAREYHEEAEVKFGDQYWLMDDDEVRQLAHALARYLRLRGVPVFLAAVGAGR